jgi:hypothetical protein
VVWIRSTVRPAPRPGLPADLLPAGFLPRPDGLVPDAVVPTVSVMLFLSSGAGGLGPSVPRCGLRGWVQLWLVRQRLLRLG